MKFKLPVKVSIDSDLILAFSKYIADNEDASIIRKMVNEHYAYPSTIQRALGGRRLDDVYKDTWLGNVSRNSSGDKWYPNLLTIADIFCYVKAGIVKLYATPTQYRSATKYGVCSDFLNQFVTKLSIKSEDLNEYLALKTDLMERYYACNAVQQNREINGEKFRRYDAPAKMAESSIFGLNMLVKRADIYLHENVENRDFNRFNRIRIINKNQGLIFPTYVDVPSTPSPFIINTFSKHICGVLYKHESENVFDLSDNNVSDDGCYINRY